MEWKDASTYSKSVADRIPTVWKLFLDNVDVTVHRHIYNKGAWHISSKFLDVDTMVLNGKEIEDAKEEALDLAAQLINKKITELQRAYQQIKR